MSAKHLTPWERSTIRVTVARALERYFDRPTDARLRALLKTVAREAYREGQLTERRTRTTTTTGGGAG